MDNIDRNVDIALGEWAKNTPRIGQTPPLLEGPALLKENLGLVTPLLALIGIVTFGILSVGYERFYAPFGVDPADVGFN
jgi:hypothetical protein